MKRELSKAMYRHERLWKRKMKRQFGQMGWMLRDAPMPRRHAARYAALERTEPYVDAMTALLWPGDEGERPATVETFYQVRVARQAAFILAGVHLATARHRGRA